MADRTFPFRPKSNASLEAGDFFGVPLPNARWACGLVLGPMPGTRVAFVGGVLDWSGTSAPTCADVEKAGVVCKVTEHHVKTITGYGLAINGNCHVDQSDYPAMWTRRKMMQGGIVLDIPLDFKAPSMPATSFGGLVFAAVRDFGGVTDPGQIQSYLETLRSDT